MTTPNSFHKFISKVLMEVADELDAECKHYGLTLSVMDKTFPKNIDVENKRLNAFVNDEFIITRIWVG